MGEGLVSGICFCKQDRLAHNWGRGGGVSLYANSAL